MSDADSSIGKFYNKTPVSKLPAGQLVDEAGRQIVEDNREGEPGVPALLTERGSAPETLQFETRRQDYSRSATAAGATRTGSDADLLGFIGSRARRAGAARRILGD